MILKTKSLSPDILKIVKNKGTEPPFTQKEIGPTGSGTYLCRQCGAALFRSQTQFYSGCGWPSFDEEIKNSVLREKDADGLRTEILCARCGAHLGHVFLGENLTPKNQRHCVNSLSLDFVSNWSVLDTEEAIFAGGCFWGAQYLFEKLPGVLKTEAGFTGGRRKHPTYQAVCKGDTGHYEAVRVLYDPQKIDYALLAQFFFEIHDPAQTDGQGPDRGDAYLSAVFYYDLEQKKIAKHLIETLKSLGCPAVTRVLPVKVFWPAEEYHQHYYTKSGQKPYCHFYTKRFGV